MSRYLYVKSVLILFRTQILSAFVAVISASSSPYIFDMAATLTRVGLVNNDNNNNRDSGFNVLQAEATRAWFSQVYSLKR